MAKFSVLIWETHKTIALHEVEAEDYDAVEKLIEVGALPTPTNVFSKTVDGDYSISEVSTSV